MKKTALSIATLLCLMPPAHAIKQTGSTGTRSSTLRSASAQNLQYIFMDKATGLSFGYPMPLKVTENPDKDTVVRIEGLQKPTNSYFAISLSHPMMAEGTQPEMAMQMLTAAAYKEAQGIKRLKSQSQYLGTRSQFRGVVQDTSFDHEGGRLAQRLVLFNDPHTNKLVLMTFMGPEAGFNSLEPMFAQVLASLDQKVIAQSAKAPARPAKDTYSSDGGVSFSYPREWAVEKDPDRDTLVKMKSDNGELRMSSMPVEYNLSLDQMQRIVEDEILSKVPKYRKLSDVSKSYGGKTSGIKETFSAEHEGTPVLGQLFFFQHGNKLYSIMLSSWGLSQADSEKRFDEIMSSLVLR